MAAGKRERVELVIVGGTEAGGSSGGGDPPAGGGADDDGPSPVWCSEDALAADLIKDLAGEWRYASSGDWYRWDGKRWQAEKLRRAWYRSRRVCRRVAKALDKSESLARKVSSAQTIHAAVRLAEADPAVAILAESFDGDIWLLNTQSGIVDLRTGQLHPHDRQRLMTRICAAAPIAAGTAGGDCPHWRQFLRDSTGRDQAFEDYLQRVAGYLLTGSIEEHAIFFLHGPGLTGKSTFQNVLAWLLADYATTAMPGLFVVAKGERHPTELATLHGRRVVIGSEVDAGGRWDEPKLKAISGGDRISARFMRGDPFEFVPTFKLLLAANKRPRLRDADDAMRRRLHLIPFTHKPLSPDPQLGEKLRTELPGILAWAIEGEVRRRLAGGLKPPKVIVDATDEYFEAENVLGRWLEERCVLGRNQSAQSRQLYADFRSWALPIGEYVWPQVEFSRRLAQWDEVRPAIVSRQKGFRGVSLKDQSTDLFDREALEDGGVVKANTVAPSPYVPDPAEDWPRE